MSNKTPDQNRWSSVRPGSPSQEAQIVKDVLELLEEKGLNAEQIVFVLIEALILTDINLCRRVASDAIGYIKCMSCSYRQTFHAPGERK